MSQFPLTPPADGSRNRPSGYDLDRLYDLLPTVIRRRDVETGQPLRALLRVIAEQVNLVDRDIGQLYDNWFIETCQPWVVPYLGDLIGYTSAPASGAVGMSESVESKLLDTFLFPRREVGNLIRYRRRKGTLLLLEQIARDAAGWPAHAVEFGPFVAASANFNNRHPRRGRTLDLRRNYALDSLGSPFDGVSHTPDVRRIGSNRTRGRFGPEAVGLFIWRMKSLPLTRTPAYCYEGSGGQHRFTFSILGNDIALYTAPVEPVDPPLPVTALDVPIPIDRRAFGQPPAGAGHHRAEASDDYYGIGKSLAIYSRVKANPSAVPPVAAGPWVMIPATKIIPADLTTWAYTAPPGRVAVDPATGRILFNADEAPGGLLVSYYYGFSAAMGGGGYGRTLSPCGKDNVYMVARAGGSTPGGPIYPSIGDALAAWQVDQDKIAPTDPPPPAVIEIHDSLAYDRFSVDLKRNGQRLEIRAASGERPTIRLEDDHADQADALLVNGVAGSSLVIDGLLITGRGITATGALHELVIRHCTLVPGWSIKHDCNPRHESDPSIEAADSIDCIRIIHSIVGAIQIVETLRPVEWTDPVRICISDSILDSTRDSGIALSASTDRRAHATVHIVRSTVVGRILARETDLLENSIFTGAVDLARRQIGCVRFCYLPEPGGSRTPRRFECQPDGAVAAANARGGSGLPGIERMRVRPRFVSLRYGTPGYGRLSDDCAAEIRTGADDESEMGVFHDLFEPQRLAGLQTRVAQFTPAAADAAVITADP